MLRFHKVLTSFYLTHADVALFLVWAPADDYLEGYKLASYIASKAAYGDPPNGLDRIQSCYDLSFALLHADTLDCLLSSLPHPLTGLLYFYDLILLTRSYLVTFCLVR